MRPRKVELARKALFQALKLRSDSGLGISQVFDVIDLAERLGFEVRFVDIPSLEAMYMNGTRPTILISAHRPPGRQAFSCAHEIAHHIFGHASKIDEQVNVASNQSRYDPDEFMANTFASFLLMPKTLVSYAFNIRGWSCQKPAPSQIHEVSGWIGVGYATLIYQLNSTLKLIPSSLAKSLLRTSPSRLRRELTGIDTAGNLQIVDSNWTDRAIDVQVGDLVLMPNAVEIEGECIRYYGAVDHGELYEATRPGIGRMQNSQSDWSSYVRVCRRGYIGRSCFRHLEDLEYG